MFNPNILSMSLFNLKTFLLLFPLFFHNSCVEKKHTSLTATEKDKIRTEIKKVIAIGLKATQKKDIDLYMSIIPKDMSINTENGESVNYETQRQNTLRDWSIIDSTLSIQMKIDSILYITSDNVLVFTSQKWERLMFRRDGINTDTILTTQKHKEIWMKKNSHWRNYSLTELGGLIYINGELYNP